MYLKKATYVRCICFHMDSLHKVCMVVHITMSVCTCQTPKRDFCWVCFLPERSRIGGEHWYNLFGLCQVQFISTENWKLMVGSFGAELINWKKRSSSPGVCGRLKETWLVSLPARLVSTCWKLEVSDTLNAYKKYTVFLQLSTNWTLLQLDTWQYVFVYKYMTFV